LLFAAERKLCDQIFEGEHTLKENCFADVTAKSLSTLLSLGEAVAKSQASPEILFMLLDMYETTVELQSEVKFLVQVSSLCLPSLSVVCNAVNQNIILDLITAFKSSATS
jgi:hypothetical protein